MKKRVLFVCLGNICRSPMAEGLFLHLLREKGLEAGYEVDSAGTAGYHVGEKPDHRMRQTAGNYGVVLPGRARQFEADDFQTFDVILGMDSSNIRNMERLRPSNNVRAKLFKMRDFDSVDTGEDVPDPYYGGLGGFDDVYRMLRRCNEKLIDYLEETNV